MRQSYLEEGNILSNKPIHFAGFPTITNQNASKANDQELIATVRAQDLPRVEQLLKSGTNVNAVDHEKMTPLMFSTLAGNVPIMRALLKHNADPNQGDLRGVTATMLACKESVPANCLQELLKNKKTDLNVQNIVGTTALMWAASFGDLEKVSLLLAHNANKTLIDHEGHSAADWAAHDAKAQCYKLLTGTEYLPQRRKF